MKQRHSLGLIAFCVLRAVAIGQPEPTAIAIRNARIVTVSGPAIARGTVVLRGGLIESVGENIATPADAMVIDGAQRMVAQSSVQRG